MTTLPAPARQSAAKAALKSSPAPERRWHERLVRSGYLVGAILFHLVLFLLLATWIVFRPPGQSHDDASFQQVAIRPPPPPEPPAPSGGEAANQFEPSAVTSPPPTAPSIVSVHNASDFSIQAVKVALPNLPASISQPAGSALAGHSTAGPTSGSGSPFGTSSSSGAADLEGYLYDLKQTAAKQPTGIDPGGYHNKIKEFIADDWNPSVFRDYYRATNPLHTSSIFVPIINASDGPKAFGVEGEVEPRMYCVWYKVTASSPQGGTFHFVGVGDDILLVRVNHRTVLDGSDFTVSEEVRRKETMINMTNYDPTFPPNGDFWIGPAFHVAAHEPADIEVLIGEEQGGKSDYFLFIQREESTYEKQSNGSPLLPIFQVDSKPIVPTGAPRSFPPYSSTPEPWATGR